MSTTTTDKIGFPSSLKYGKKCMRGTLVVRMHKPIDCDFGQIQKAYIYFHMARNTIEKGNHVQHWTHKERLMVDCGVHPHYIHICVLCTYKIYKGGCASPTKGTFLHTTSTNNKWCHIYI